MVSIRDNKEITKIHFDTDHEALDKYFELTSDKKAAPKVEEIKIEDLKEDGEIIKHCDPDEINSLISNYVNDNITLKCIKSARHLNKKFSLKLKQKEYDEILKGL